MGLDYWNPKKIINFRDVGMFVNLIAGKKQLSEGRILRGGSILYLESLNYIGNPKTIISLRNGADEPRFQVAYLHFPMSNRHEKYHTSDPEVRRWLNSIVSCLQTDLEYPLYFHCTSGKDRTGVVIAALLYILGIERKTITEEYLLSEGDIAEHLIVNSLDRLGNPYDYFKGIDLDLVRKKIIGGCKVNKENEI